MRVKDIIKEAIEEQASNRKATLEFNLDDIYTESAYRRAVNADNAYQLIHKITQEIFRPARKHGYSRDNINKLVDACGEDEEGYSRGVELVGELEEVFYELLQESGVDLEDYS